MELIFKRGFVKQYQKLSEKQKTKVNVALELFTRNPQEKVLKNHALKGRLSGKRAISAGFDLRIVFKEEGGYVRVLLLGVGGHSRVY